MAIQNCTQILACVSYTSRIIPYQVCFPIPTLSTNTTLSYLKNTRWIGLWRSTLTSSEVTKGELVAKNQMMAEKD